MAHRVEAREIGPASASFLEVAASALPVVGRSRAALEMLSLVESLAGTDTNILITGESGAGKELIARLLHLTGRRRRAYLAHNCAAIAEGTLESDLFGHVAGAYTGAVGGRAGLFEEANGGTLFLDEIGEITARLQAQLLRVLQEGEIKRVGESRVRRVDVRVLAATNRNLAAEVRAGRFREDLFYRLNVMQVRVPPLRERRADIPLFVRSFLGESARADEPPGEVVTAEAMEVLMSHSWPGNVRQLRNEILRAALLTRGRHSIRPEDLSEDLLAEAGGATAETGSLRDRVDVAQRRIVLGTLHEHRWNKTRAARSLGVTRQGLIKMIHRLGLPLQPPETMARG
jgi:transcriptional regulator with GAF, ATPase, and Fis domain